MSHDVDTTETRRLARIAFIVECRARGMSYNQVGLCLERKGFGPCLSAQRVKEIVKQHRPDLMGSVSALRRQK